MKYRPLVYVALLFALGIWLGETFPIPCRTICLCLLGYAVLFVCLPHLPIIAYLFLLVMGMWRLSLTQTPPSICLPEKKLLCRIQGMVVTPPFPSAWFATGTTNKDVRGGEEYRRSVWVKNWSVVEILAIIQPAQGARVTGKIKVVVEGEIVHPWQRGDIVEMLGWLMRFSSPGNPGEWDYAFSWHARGVDYRFRVAHPQNITIVRRRQGCALLNFFSRLRYRCVERLRTALGPEPGNLLASLVLDCRRLLSDELVTAFTTTGLIHLLAISGLHISLVACFLYHAFKWLGIARIAATGIVLLVVLAYSLLTELEPSVVRAVIMLGVYMAAPLCGRQADALNSLACAGIILLWYNPYELFSPGFQLSFAACLAIIVWMELRQGEAWEHTATKVDPLQRSSIWQWGHKLCVYLRESLLLSLSAWAGTAPLLAYFFFQIPLLTAITTVVCAPLVTLLLAGSLLLLFSPFGLGWVAWVLSQSLIGGVWLWKSLVVWLASIPAVCYLLPPLGIAIAVFYTFLMFLPAISSRKWQGGALVMALLLVLCSGRCRAFTPSGPRITVLDVGHSTAIYLRLTHDRHVLYDCGSALSQVGSRILVPFLRYHGVHTLDAVILSHYDSDHYGGLQELLPRVGIRQIFCNRILRERGLPLRQLLHTYGMSLTEIGDAQTPASFPELTFFNPGQYLSFPQDYADNEHSLLVLVSFTRGKLLLTGDMGPRSLQVLLESPPPQVDTLQIPHHGSYLPETEEMLDILKPRIAFISGREGFASPRTIQCYLARHIRLWATYESGALTIVPQPNGIEVTGFRRNR